MCCHEIMNFLLLSVIFQLILSQQYSQESLVGKKMNALQALLATQLRGKQCRITFKSDQKKITLTSVRSKNCTNDFTIAVLHNLHTSIWLKIFCQYVIKDIKLHSQLGLSDNLRIIFSDQILIHGALLNNTCPPLQAAKFGLFD